jgi:hypothetical protein
MLQRRLRVNIHLFEGVGVLGRPKQVNVLVASGWLLAPLNAQVQAVVLRQVNFQVPILVTLPEI